MKVLLFSEGMNLIKISGLGRAIMHQQKALKLNGIEYTLDPKDDYDVVHINTLGLKSKALAKKAKKGMGIWRAKGFQKTIAALSVPPAVRRLNLLATPRAITVRFAFAHYTWT